MKDFKAKILLFGEYSIIQNSMALAIPFDKFSGQLKFPANTNEMNIEGNRELKTFCQYLESLDHDENIASRMDLETLRFDIAQGLIFDSSIAQGHGLGSSGALCASIYDKYKTQHEDLSDLNDLRCFFSLLEGHFHGSSSGLDPLVSYLERPVLVNKQGKVQVTETVNGQSGECFVFIFNSGRSAKTEPLVNLYLEKLKSKDFSLATQEIFIPVVDRLVHSLLEKDALSLFENFKVLSDFQLEKLSPMIPKFVQPYWKLGLSEDLFSLKLCGGGGGGYMLGVTKNLDQAKSVLRDFQIQTLFRV